MRLFHIGSHRTPRPRRRRNGGPSRDLPTRVLSTALSPAGRRTGFGGHSRSGHLHETGQAAFAQPVSGSSSAEAVLYQVPYTPR
jgi:hypothetical protein